MRHYHPARWPPDDGLGRAPPDPFAQPRMTVGPHDQEIGASDFDLRLEYLPDGTAINPHRFKACVDAMFGQMADHCRTRLLVEAATAGMERRQERRTGRHERRESRRTGRHERRETRRGGGAEPTTTGQAK
jgi:hypothetical protein